MPQLHGARRQGLRAKDVNGEYRLVEMESESESSRGQSHCRVSVYLGCQAATSAVAASSLLARAHLTFCLLTVAKFMLNDGWTVFTAW